MIMHNIPVSDSECLLKLPFWEQMSSGEKELVRENSVIKKYGKGQLICNSGEECGGLTMVLDGELRISILSDRGREITLYRLQQNEICALTASCILSQITFDTQTTASDDCTVLLINSFTFEKLMNQNIYVRCFMYELLTQRFSSVMWTMQMILFNGYDRRLASFLIGEYERTGLKTIQMTHEQIAQYTNSVREVVARMLKRFVNEGLVELERGKITLIDIESLRKMK